MTRKQKQYVFIWNLTRRIRARSESVGLFVCNVLCTRTCTCTCTPGVLTYQPQASRCYTYICTYIRMEKLRRCRVAPSPSSPTTHYMHVSTAPIGNPGVLPPPSPAAPLAPGRNVKRKPPMLANLIWGGTVLHTQSSFEINFKGGEGIEKRFNVRMGWSVWYVWYTVKYK